MQQNLEIFETIDFFSKFPSQSLKLLAFLSKRLILESGDIFFSEGDEQSLCFYVISGSLKAACRQCRHDFYLHPGEFYASLSLIAAAPSLFTIEANQQTEVMIISRDTFKNISEQFPETYRLTVESCIQKIYHWERQQCLSHHNFSPGVSLI